MNFKSLKEAIKYFSDEKVCKDYLIQQRWNDKPECPFCGCTKVYNIENGKRFKCSDKECYKKFSVTVGTIYENSNLPLSTWFTAAWILSAHKKGISSCQLARDLGITQKAAWFVLHRLRIMLTDKAPQLLKGQVQIDETYVGGSEKNKHASKRTKHSAGRSSLKVPVIGIYEKDGKVVTQVTPWLTRKATAELITKNVEKGSIMVTDSFGIYKHIGKGTDYTHIVVNHSEGEYVTQGQFHTNNVENFWSLLKRGIIGIYHYTSYKHLHRYCNEFAYRYNTRKLNDANRFEATIKNSEGRLKYKDLIK